MNQNEQELLLLNRRDVVSKVILAEPALKNTDRLLLRWLAGILMRAQTAEYALQAWKALSFRAGRTLDSYSETQRNELSCDDTVIISLYYQAKTALDNTDFSEKTATAQNRPSGHIWNDRYQFAEKPKRPLSLLMERGIGLQIPVEKRATLASLLEEDSCPILDSIKGEKIFTINGFQDSKAALSIHDIFDHFWIYWMAQNHGLFDKYQAFFASIGNPHLTDIYKREGELLAAVGYDYRAYKQSEPTYNPLFPLGFIKEKLKQGLESSLNTNNVVQALAILESTDASGDEVRCLLYVINGMTLELTEQRRKFGFIKQKKTVDEARRVLPMLDVDYLSLVIEANHMLWQRKETTDAALLAISLAVEEFLVEISRGESNTDQLTLTLEKINGYNLDSTKLPPKRVAWIKDNLGFSADRRSSC